MGGTGSKPKDVKKPTTKIKSEDKFRQPLADLRNKTKILEKILLDRGPVDNAIDLELFDPTFTDTILQFKGPSSQMEGFPIPIWTNSALAFVNCKYLQKLLKPEMEKYKEKFKARKIGDPNDIICKRLPWKYLLDIVIQYRYTPPELQEDEQKQLMKKMGDLDPESLEDMVGGGRWMRGGSTTDASTDASTVSTAETTASTEKRPLSQIELGVEDRVREQVAEITKSATTATQFQEERENRIVSGRSKKDEDYQRKRKEMGKMSEEYAWRKILKKFIRFQTFRDKRYLPKKDDLSTVEMAFIYFSVCMHFKDYNLLKYAELIYIERLRTISSGDMEVIADVEFQLNQLSERDRVDDLNYYVGTHDITTIIRKKGKVIKPVVNGKWLTFEEGGEKLWKDYPSLSKKGGSLRFSPQNLRKLYSGDCTIIVYGIMTNDRQAYKLKQLRPENISVKVRRGNQGTVRVPVIKFDVDGDTREHVIIDINIAVIVPQEYMIESQSYYDDKNVVGLSAKKLDELRNKELQLVRRCSQQTGRPTFVVRRVAVDAWKNKHIFKIYRYSIRSDTTTTRNLTQIIPVDTVDDLFSEINNMVDKEGRYPVKKSDGTIDNENKKRVYVGCKVPKRSKYEDEDSYKKRERVRRRSAGKADI